MNKIVIQSRIDNNNIYKTVLVSGSMMRGFRYLHSNNKSDYKHKSTVVTHSLNNKELQTTDIDDKAIAILAIHGCSDTPRGTNTPAARGIPTRL